MTRKQARAWAFVMDDLVRRGSAQHTMLNIALGDEAGLADLGLAWTYDPAQDEQILVDRAAKLAYDEALSKLKFEDVPLAAGQLWAHRKCVSPQAEIDAVRALSEAMLKSRVP